MLTILINKLSKFMNHDSLVSINIYHSQSLQILNKVPLLYYWDGEGRLIYNIVHDKKIINEYFNNLNYDKYKNLELSYFYFKYDEEYNEIYTEDIVKVSDYIDLDEFNSNNLIYELIIHYLYKLYKISMKTEYGEIKVFNKEIILDIYNQLKIKFKEKFEDQTFINWVRKEILNNENLNNKNVNYIINTLQNILKSN